MSHDVSMVRAKLRAALDKIGKSNGPACPPTDSNIDGELHELFITAECAAYWKTRHEKAKTSAMAVAMTPDELHDMVTRVSDNMVGESIMAASGDLYAMTLDLNKPALRLNSTALKSSLQIDYGLSLQQVNDAFADCSDYSAPAKKMKVVNK